MFFKLRELYELYYDLTHRYHKDPWLGNENYVEKHTDATTSLFPSSLVGSATLFNSLYARIECYYLDRVFLLY